MPDHSPETVEVTEEVIKQQPAWVTDIGKIGLDSHVLESIVPHSLPGAEQLVPYFRNNYRGVYEDSGTVRQPPEHYVPTIMALILSGNRALITDDKTPEEEGVIVHRAISLNGFDHGDFPAATQVCLEIEAAVLSLRQIYRQRLALRQTVESGLETALQTAESTYHLARMFAHTYTTLDKAAVSPTHQGLLELLVTPLEPGKSKRSLPHMLLGRLAAGEFRSFVTRDVFAQTITGNQQLHTPPTPHIRSVVDFSRSLVSGLDPVPDDDSLTEALTNVVADGLLPKEASSELSNAEKQLHNLFTQAIKRAVASVADQGWREFDGAPRAFEIARTEALLKLSDWVGWPFNMGESRKQYATDLRTLKQGSRQKSGVKPQKPRRSEAIGDNSETLRRNTLMYVDIGGHRHSLDSPKANGAIITYLYKDAAKSRGLLEPIFQYLERFDFSSYDKRDRTTQFIRPTGKETDDGRQVYRLILGQLQGAHAMDNRVRASQLIFSVNASPSSAGNEVYIHSFANSATYTVAAANVAQVMQTVPEA